MQESIQNLTRPPRSFPSRKEMKSQGISPMEYFFVDKIHKKGLYASSSSSSSSSSSQSKNGSGLRSVRGLRYQLAACSERMRRQQANKEILRRALTPPIKRLSRRWLNFKPTPSRLSNMSGLSYAED